MHKDKWLNCKVHNCKRQGNKEQRSKSAENKKELITQNNFDCKMYSKFSMIQDRYKIDGGPFYSLKLKTKH